MFDNRHLYSIDSKLSKATVGAIGVLLSPAHFMNMPCVLFRSQVAIAVRLWVKAIDMDRNANISGSVREGLRTSLINIVRIVFHHAKCLLRLSHGLDLVGASRARPIVQIARNQLEYFSVERELRLDLCGGLPRK